MKEEQELTVEKSKMNLADLLGKSQNKNKSPEIDPCCSNEIKQHSKKVSTPPTFELASKMQGIQGPLGGNMLLM